MSFDNIFDDATQYAKDAINSIGMAVNKYYVAPHDNYGIGGFLFDIGGDVTATLNADITDHTVEDNTTMQDHITIKPKRIVLRGYVGELVYKDAYGAVGLLASLTGKLSTLTDFIPQLRSQAQQMYSEINAAGASIDYYADLASSKLAKARDLWSLFDGIENTATTKQERAFKFFKETMENKILVSVQTPFEYFPNMAIESITATQHENSQHISDFAITLKQIRKAQVKKTAYVKSPVDEEYSKDLQSNVAQELQGRASIQGSTKVSLGNMQGQKTVSSGKVPPPATPDELKTNLENMLVNPSLVGATKALER